MIKQTEMPNLKNRLMQADVVCKDCGEKYGKYSVGCSSTWMGTCGVCGEEKGITEVRDWGYLTKGINDLKGKIKQQSKEVAKYMLTQEPIMTDEELDDTLTASYEQGEITLKLSEDEVGFLNECLDVICENHESLCGDESECPEDVALFESIEKKITDLYEDNCVKYSPSPEIMEYNKKYGTWGIGKDAERWEKFRDNYEMLVELGFITEAE